MNMTGNLSDLLDTMRNNADEKFNEIFSSAIAIAREIQTSITTPRTIGRRIHRDNYIADEFDGKSIFILFFESLHISHRLSDRLIRHRNIQNVLPKFVSK